MRKKRIMIIGPGKSGKTTLAAWLEDSSDIRRVQNMVYRKNKQRLNKVWKVVKQ